VERGFVNPGVAPSIAGTRAFSSDDVETLKSIGRLKPGTSVLSLEDIEAIRELATHGLSSRKIAERYPVSDRQIRRIVSGERWKKLA
jgi:predicted DNA-binding protein (UPF0251 family)